MTYDFALTEAERRHAALGKDYAICYSERERGYMVIPLQSAIARDLLIVDKVTKDDNLTDEVCPKCGEKGVAFGAACHMVD